MTSDQGTACAAKNVVSVEASSVTLDTLFTKSALVMNFAILNPGYLHVSLPLILGSTSIVVGYQHESSVVGLVDITPLLFGVLESVCGTERQI